uniref:Acetolactate synthase n=1 Tax=Populus trichocarpa TaxID=3694 RepID=A0A2K1YBI6_POPTR
MSNMAAVAAAPSTSTAPIYRPPSPSKAPLPISTLTLTLPSTFNHTKTRSLHISNSLSKPISSTATTSSPTTEKFSFPRFAPDEPRKGADILVEALEREGVTDVFAYPGGASLEIHQALTRSNKIRNVLPRHEQGGVFAAEGYARASGLPGVCIATSGPGATNLVSGLADALLDSVPIVAITGQVPRRMIGTDAFQETPIVEVTRSITKHNYLVLDVDDIPRIIKEAFFLASSGRPGPVLIDIPKDIQQQLAVPNWDVPMKLPGYLSRLPRNPNELHLEQIVRLISESKKPVLYVGGGCLNSSEELRRFVELTGIPVASTLMGLGAFPVGDELSLQMLGMHGTVYANYAVDKSDLLLAFGVRFDDRGLGAMGFGLPAAIGAAVANPDSIVVDIDGDGSFIMNIQELATIRVENLPVKIMLLNNQHLGMVVQWEDRFYKANRAHTYLGNPSNESEIFPNMLKFAEACGIPAARITRKDDLRAAIQKMLNTPGPYLLDVIVPHQEHVLPMIPSGGAFKDVITEGDGRTKY